MICYNSKLNKFLKDKPAITKQGMDGRELNNETRATIAATINALPECNLSKRMILLGVITDVDKYFEIDTVNNLITAKKPK